MARSTPHIVYLRILQRASILQRGQVQLEALFSIAKSN